MRREPFTARESPTYPRVSPESTIRIVSTVARHRPGPRIAQEAHRNARHGRSGHSRHRQPRHRRQTPAGRCTGSRRHRPIAGTPGHRADLGLDSYDATSLSSHCTYSVERNTFSRKLHNAVSRLPKPISIGACAIGPLSNLFITVMSVQSDRALARACQQAGPPATPAAVDWRTSSVQLAAYRPSIESRSTLLMTLA